MTYYERSALLKNTLDSFMLLGYKNDIEVIIVDDGSIIEPLKVDENKYNFPVKCIILPTKNKNHINSCIPYNQGFKNANGDIVIIQNAECIHLNNIVAYAKKNCTDDNYLSFSCYSLEEDITEEIKKNGWEAMQQFLTLEKKPAKIDGHSGWYNHSIYKPNAYHFCSAILNKNLKILGGFDEKYSHGIGFDDDELIYRIRKFPLRVEIIDEVSVLHQFHYNKRVYNKQLDDKMHSNWVLYKFYTKGGQKALRYMYYKLYNAIYSRGYKRIAKILRQLYPGFSKSLKN